MRQCLGLATLAAARVLGVGVALAMVLAGCGTRQDGSRAGAAEPPAEPVTIRLGWGTPGQEPFYVMRQHPEVAPNLGSAYRVEWVDGPGGARGLASGVTDGGAMASLSAATAIGAGAEVVIAGALIEERDPNRPMTWLVRADAGINSLADLAGETVGTIGEGTFADVVADHVIRGEGGLAPGTDYAKAEVPFPQMREALLAGQIATGPFPPPFLQQTLASGQAVPLFDVRDAADALVATVLCFRREFVDDNPEAVAAFMADWAAVHGWIADPANRDLVIEATSQVTDVPAEALEPYLLTQEDGHRPPNGSLDVDTLQRTWDFFADSGVIPRLNVADHVLPELLPPPD